MLFDDGTAALRSTGAAVRVKGHRRSRLTAGWQVAACPPGSCAAPVDAARLDWLPAAVPGTAAGALRDAGRWDFADGRDLDAEDWWFRTEFEAVPAGSGERVLLRLDGIATVHEVFLNGEVIAVGSSMFAGAEVDVGARLRPGPNELSIRCLALAPELGKRRTPRARWRTRLADNRLRFVRTMLLGRCPGFAPGPAAVGPWRPVLLERRRGLEIAGIALRARCEDTDGHLAVRARVRMLDDSKIDAAEVVVGEVRAPLAVRRSEGGELALSGDVRVAEVVRWWPHTHGEPHLYDVSLRVRSGDEETEVDAGRVGFRGLTDGPDRGHDASQDGIDLHLNGARVFARGVVWTPDDFVSMAPDPDCLRAALQRVRDAGMNMVRIPGTAAYESFEFHDLCDELGILVWQDLMFANFDYPFADDDFRAQVEDELRSVLADLGGRASLAVLCGNSEVEQQVAMLGLDAGAYRDEFFGSVLPRLAEEADLDATYLPSAPCGGSRPFSPDAGVANYFGVGGYRRPLSDARLADVRFASECLAIANVPDASGVAAIMPDAGGEVVLHHPRWKAGVPRDAGTGWDFDDVRDHYLKDLYGVDPGELRRYDHDRYLELSREVSGELMATVFHEWRRAGSRCRGGLVLWLRDLVPGAGWGVVDAQGKPKVAYHHLRRALSPIAVWMTDERLAGVAVHVANDRAAPLVADLRLALYQGFEHLVRAAVVPIEVDPHGGIEFDLETLLGGFVDASWAYRFGPPAQTLIVAGVTPAAGEEVSRSLLMPAGPPLGQESPEDLGLEAEAVRDHDGSAALRLRSRRMVHAVRLEGSGILAEDDAFSLEPGRDRLLSLDHQAGSAEGSLSITALNLLGRLIVPLAPLVETNPE